MDLVLQHIGSWQNDAIATELENMAVMAEHRATPERIVTLGKHVRVSGTQVKLIMDDLIWLMTDALATMHGLDIALNVEREQAWQGSPEIKDIERRIYGLSQLLSAVSSARYAGDNLTVKIQ